MDAEKLLVELNRLRQDFDPDPDDIEWLAVHHAFCFISYNISRFQEYLDENARLEDGK